MSAPDGVPGPSLRSEALGGTIERRVRWACVLSLIALALILGSLFDPTPLPVIVAMSVGQGIGTIALGLYVIAILLDLRRARVLERGRSMRP